eukprot:CCRYP_013042-RA/>CCRYP_013042-RA protein AED:0.34 eAED:0.28 QI:0/0/0/1/0/0/5/0/633
MNHQNMEVPFCCHPSKDSFHLPPVQLDLEQTDITLNMMHPCTQNPNLSAQEAMEGMFSFDATPMAPIGTECMVHLKPSRGHTWGYHAIKAWYFAPALNHSRCDKVVTDTGAVRATDTFKFLHHTLPAPTITPTCRIVKATKHLKQAIEGHTTPGPDELEVIAALKALINGTMPDPPLPEPAAELQPQAIVTQWSKSLTNLRPCQTVTTPPPLPNQQSPTAIPFDDNELDAASVIGADDIMPPRQYNLRSQARDIIQSAFDNGLVIPQDHIAFAVVDEEIGQALEYGDLIKMDKHKEIWSKSYANELGRLTQGIRDLPGTNMMLFIHKKDITYDQIVVVVRPQKKEQECTRLTTIHGRLPHQPETSPPPSTLSTLSSPPLEQSLWLWMSIFYLNTPMEQPEFMRLQMNLIPGEFVEKYNLKEKVDNKGWVYVGIELGMYCLPQAGLLANKLLEKWLNLEGYYHCQYTPGLWHHVWRPITISLVVDNFGIKTVGLTHTKHLKRLWRGITKSTLTGGVKSIVAPTWTGTTKIKQSTCRCQDTYPKHSLVFNIPPVQAAGFILQGHPNPIWSKGTTHQGTRPDASPKLSPQKIKHIQQVVGTLLYYLRVVDPTLAAALSTIASQQSNGTQAVMDASQ